MQFRARFYLNIKFEILHEEYITSQSTLLRAQQFPVFFITFTLVENPVYLIKKKMFLKFIIRCSPFREKVQSVQNPKHRYTYLRFQILCSLILTISTKTQLNYKSLTVQ